MNVTKLYNDLEAHSHLFDYFSVLKKDLEEIYAEIETFDFSAVHHRVERHLFVSFDKFRRAVTELEDDVRKKMILTEEKLLTQSRGQKIQKAG